MIKRLIFTTALVLLVAGASVWLLYDALGLKASISLGIIISYTWASLTSISNKMSYLIAKEQNRLKIENGENQSKD